MSDPYAAAKRAAGRAAADLVRPGQRIGLGTGSTVVHVLDRLGERVRDEKLDFLGVPTSVDTARRSTALGIRLTTLDDVDTLDLTIDGADEIDARKNMIKGGGGALVRERIVAAAAKEMVVVVSANKVVDALGSTFLLPVEILQFGVRQTLARLARLGCEPRLRKQADGNPFVTDNGNWIADCKFAPITDPGGLHRLINTTPGVLDSGLFVGIAGRVFVGEQDGRVRTIP